MYIDKVRDAARDYISEIEDDLIEAIFDNESLHRNYDRYSYSLNDFLDGTEFYDPEEAVSVLLQLSQWEETDRGLVRENAGWKDTVRTLALYTYQNAVRAYVDKAFNELDCLDIDEIKNKYFDDKVPTNEELKQAIAEEIKYAIATV